MNRRIAKFIAGVLLIASMTAVALGNGLSNKVFATTQNGWSYESVDSYFEEDELGWFYYENGSRVKGWKFIDNKWYYFEENDITYRQGRMIKNCWRTLGGTLYHFANSGAMDIKGTHQNGWIYEEIRERVNASTTVHAEGWFYYEDGQKATGWRFINNKWYYLLKNTSNEALLDYSNGIMMQNCWYEIDNVWYRFDSNGVYVENARNKTGWVSFTNKNLGVLWIYFEQPGQEAHGWKNISGKWYYFDEHGYMMANSLVDGYYLDTSGAMVNRAKWVNIGANGVDAWVYINSNGKPASGWFKVNGKWYYAYGQSEYLYSYVVYTNTTRTIDGETYRFDSNGAMVTGWYKSGSLWYYYYPDGRMARDTVIDGCQINSSGYWRA